MKKIYLSILMSISFGAAQSQFSENIGTTAPSSGSFPSISTYTGWQNSTGFTYSGSGDVRSSSPSSTYAGASGGSNIYLTNNSSKTFQIGTLNTIALVNPTLNLGLYKSAIASDASELTFEYSTDGTNFIQISTPVQITGSGTANWRKIQILGLPKSSALTIKFTNTGTNTQFRIDDVIIDDLLVLPISLTSFTGKAVDKNILLSWNTASEINNNYFEVKHSIDGKAFTAIGKVNGAGNFTTAKDYSFADENPASGTNYYQLLQHDFDGKTSSSAVVAVDSKIEAAQLTVYASSSDVKISISSPNQTKGFIQLFDLSGRKLADQAITVNKGFNNINLALSLPKGIHFARYTAEGVVVNQKFAR